MKLLTLNFICLIVQARCPDLTMISGSFAAACLIHLRISSMIVATIILDILRWIRHAAAKLPDIIVRSGHRACTIRQMKFRVNSFTEREVQ